VKRREFIALLAGVAAAPGGATAALAQATKVFRIGLLETVPVERNRANYEALRRGLRELGYVENRNLAFEYRSAEGKPDRFPALAEELVRSRVDLIVTRGTPSALAAKASTDKAASDKIPIVMAAIGEPLNVGVVATLAHPGGNVTGFSSFATELSGKRVELLKEALPSISRIGFMMNMANSSAPPQWQQIQAAASATGLAATLFDIREASDIAGAFAAMAEQQIQGLTVGVEAVIQANAETIVRAAADQKILVVFVGREFVEIGGLLSYGPSYADLYYRSAGLIDRIFKGARPGDLPVAQPVKLELVINLKTASVLGLTMPPTLIARADEVIE
jgi:putative ABC transport system substrate-binding protein